MKKILFSFLSLMGFGFSVFAQSHINIELLGATYTTPAVQFRVSWNSIPSVAGETHNAKIWLWVDFIKIENNQPSGSWTRATVANPSPGTVAPETNKGFWLQGNTGSYNQIVTVALTNIPENTTFNWCAHASDCPPTATTTNGTYTLKGTPPFTITYNDGSSTTTNENTFNLGCVTAIADRTENPASSVTAKPTVTASSPTICYNTAANLTATVSGGITTAMTYTWIIGGTSSTTSVPTKTTSALTANTTYTVQARNAAGCTGAVSNKGTITVINPAVPGISVSPSSACVGSALTFTATGGSGYYEWSGNVSGTGNNKTTGTAAGTYTARVQSYISSGVTCYSSQSSPATGHIRTCVATSNPGCTYYTGSPIFDYTCCESCHDNCASFSLINETDCANLAGTAGFRYYYYEHDNTCEGECGWWKLCYGCN